MNEPTRLTTRLNPKWLVRMAIFFVLLGGLGVWGAIDAFWVYPAQGRHYAQFTLRAHLECLDKENRLLIAASVEDPAAELARLDAANAIESRTCDALKHAWLRSLSRLHRMSALTALNRDAITKAGGPIGVATTTMFADPRATLDDLNARLGTASTPKPLSAYDLPMQYLFMVLGIAGAAWIAFFVMRCGRVRYAYEPAEHRLIMPDGRSFVPADIKEVDKRDWHKYFMHVALNDGSREMKFDLLRYLPLEAWLLEMEKLHPNYTPPPPEEDTDETETSPEGPLPEDANAGPRDE